LIVGFVIGGAGTAGGRSILLRGVGPTLNRFGVSGTLTDPEIEVWRAGRRAAGNDNWGGAESLATAFASAGAFAFTTPGSRDAALLLPDATPDAYSVIVRGVGGTSGIALAEVYDTTAPRVPPTPEARLINLSARATVGGGDDLVIAGFVLTGTGTRRVLLRAVGPTLADFGVAGALGNPQLTVHRDGSAIAANDDWGGGPALRAAFADAGAFQLPPASADAALLLTLSPGSYTAQVVSAGGPPGIALVEIYELP
jgi:hypothetical protein